MGTATSGCVELKIFSQTDSQSEHLGIQHIIQAVETVKQLRSAETTQNGSSPASLVPLEKRVRVIAVGGDGAFTWMMMAISKAGTDMEWVASGIIPSGTGNDLAHTYGWVNAGFPSHAPLSDKKFEGLVGSVFDRMRGKSRFWNRLVYGLLFLRFASTDLEVCSAIDTIYTLRASGLLAVLSNNPKYKKVPRLMPCVSLTFLNTRTILGGLELWRPTVKVGVLPPADPAVLPQFEHFYHQLLTAESSTGDGMLEVLSMESTADYFNAQVVSRRKRGATNTARLWPIYANIQR
ncbi:putative diacylglycerol kinase [Cyclospora cayetanensis]|uniref:Diacylglycerol kinase n=1 Tax=Cyclospora cayetanensis TaxID=88456 RepID=A0A1D3DA67_9EIME|nr:putative diacylglycerol kinase [Cyclospora cayetanensis]